MFGFRKKKPHASPGSSSGNGAASTGASAAAGEGQPAEEIDLLGIAAAALAGQGHTVTRENTWLVHNESGYRLLPHWLDASALGNSAVRTTTVLQIMHPVLVPQGVFEYQHATGQSVQDSLATGFDQWAQMDFVALLEALLDKPANCTALEMVFEARDERPARTRRAVLGPVAHFMQQPPVTEAADAESSPDEHPFCSCCLLTRSFEAFQELIEDDGFYGVRFFASRDAEGNVEADCRVNGQDWEKGAQALRAYARTWPPAGFEFRKQYVVLQTIERAAQP